MLVKPQKKIIAEANSKALKKARLYKKLSRKELAQRLNITNKAIEKFENGRDQISQERLNRIIEAIGISMDEFVKIKRGKNIIPSTRIKNVIKNSDRRSYNKFLTKEVKVLKTLRRIKEISQDKASYICGYSRPTMGHIENGRISLSRERIIHIITCYGYNYSDFEKHMDTEILRDDVLDYCIKKLKKLGDDKLNLLRGILDSMGV